MQYAPDMRTSLQPAIISPYQSQQIIYTYPNNQYFAQPIYFGGPGRPTVLHRQSAPAEMIHIPDTSDKDSNKSKKKKQKPSKKVLVICLPEGLQTLDSVTQRFAKYGEIVLVRVLKPGKVLPFDLKLMLPKVHDLGRNICAVIEFEQAVSAKRSVETEKNNGLRLAVLQNGIDVALYGSTSEATSSTSEEKSNHESGIDFSITSAESNSDNMSDKEAKKERSNSVSHWPAKSERSHKDSNCSDRSKENANPIKYNPKAASFVPRNSISEGMPILGQITHDTINGRCITSLAVNLKPFELPKKHRNTKKLDLTKTRHEAPSMQQPKPVRYGRDFLFALKENRASLQLPNELPNIPELLPTAKQPLMSMGKRR